MHAFIESLERLIKAIGRVDAFERAATIIFGEWPASHDCELYDVYRLLSEDEKHAVNMGIKFVAIMDRVHIPERALGLPCDDFIKVVQEPDYILEDPACRGYRRD